MKKALSILLSILLLLGTVAFSLTVAAGGSNYPNWSFDYNEKTGVVHHRGDRILTKADFIKHRVLSMLYSGEGLNALFESIYADVGNRLIDLIWQDPEPLDTSVCYLYVQGLPNVMERAIPLAPALFRSDNPQGSSAWYRFFDGSTLPYSYTAVLQSLDNATLFTDKAALWSVSLLGKHTADLSFWRVPETVPVSGTTATVPAQNSRSSLIGSGTIVDAFPVDAVNDVVDSSFMRNAPQKTWGLDPNHPQTLYSALAACFCGYASVINAALCGNALQIDSDVEFADMVFSTAITGASEAGIFYTQFLQPLYEALGVENYLSLDKIASHAAISQTAEGAYTFSQEAGQALFREMLAPIVDWIETVLIPDPVNVLAEIAPTVYALFDPESDSSIMDLPAVNISIKLSEAETRILSLCYKDIFAKLLALLNPNDLLEEYLQCAEGHAWDMGVITTAATCITEGVKHFTCTRCEATKDAPVPIDSAVHANLSDIAAAEATATEHGFTAGRYCPDCNTWVSGHAVIHNRLGAQTVLQAPTATEDGLVDIVCTVCGEHGQYTVSATGPQPGGNDSGGFWAQITNFFRGIVDWFLRLFRWMGK